MKGITEVVFILFFGMFLVSFVFITSQLAPYGVPTITPVDLGVLGVSVVGVGVACTIITGAACVGAAVISSVINIFAIPPVYSMVFIPLIFVFSYIIAKLARGGG